MNWYVMLVFMIQYVVSSGQKMTEERIVNGTIATQNQFPWMAAMYWNVFNTISPAAGRLIFACGGTIISRNIILTAAHCVFELKKRVHPPEILHQYGHDEIRIVVGTSDLSDINNLRMLLVKSIIIYPTYNYQSLQDDIALIKLSENLIFQNGRIESLPLERGAIYNKQVATVAGWGDTCSHKPEVITEDHLRFRNVEILPVENCKNIWVTNRIKHATILCVGHGLPIYKGDSGSGLWMTNNMRTSLIGIVSFNQNCTIGKAAIFTKVSFFYDWIVNTANNLMNSD